MKFIYKLLSLKDFFFIEYSLLVKLCSLQENADDLVLIFLRINLSFKVSIYKMCFWYIAPLTMASSTVTNDCVVISYIALTLTFHFMGMNIFWGLDTFNIVNMLPLLCVINIKFIIIQYFCSAK